MVLTPAYGHAADLAAEAATISASPFLRDQTPSEFAAGVAFAAEAVKGLRYAPINSANYKIVRCALDCLPRYGWEGI